MPNNPSQTYPTYIELPHHCNRKPTTTSSSSSSLPLSREVLSYYTNFVSKVFKLYKRQRLSQYINHLLLGRNILELYSSLLHHVSNIMELYLYVFWLVLKYQVLHHLDATLIIRIDISHIHVCIKQYCQQLANPNSFTIRWTWWNVICIHPLMYWEKHRYASS